MSARLILAVAVLLGSAVAGYAASAAEDAVARIRSVLPAAVGIAADTVHARVPGAYESDPGFCLLPDGRYFYFAWSEAGPATRDYDTGTWTVRDGLVELAPGPGNAVIRESARRFVPVEIVRRQRPALYLVEIGANLDALVDALTKRRAEWTPASMPGWPGGDEIATNDFERNFAFEHDAWQGTPYLTSFAEVAGELNRAAAARPVPSSRLDEFVERARRYVPSFEAAPARSAADVAGFYSGSFGMGGRCLYLLPDGGYFYITNADVPTLTEFYHQGTWTLREGVVELRPQAGDAGYGQPRELRFFAVRTPVHRRGDTAASTRMRLLGTDEEAGRFLAFAGGMEAAVRSDRASGRSLAPAGMVRLDDGDAITFDSPIPAREAAELRRKFQEANTAHVTAERMSRDFKIESSAGSYRGPLLTYSEKCSLTVDGIKFFAGQVVPDAGPTTLRLTGSVRAEINGQTRNLRSTTLYLEGTKLVGASPMIEFGGRRIGPPVRR